MSNTVLLVAPAWGTSPGKSLGGNEYFQNPRSLLILTVAQLLHTVKLQLIARGFKKVFGPWRNMRGME